MGNIDSVPVVSQVKSLTQEIAGDSAGALATQQHFAYNNTFPVVSQIASLGYYLDGKPEEAKDLQVKFAKDAEKIIDSIPVAGHIKGGVHYLMGDKEEGDEAMKAASHSTGVVIGGIGGFALGGPVGAMAGGIAGGAAMDTVITESDKLIHGKNASDYGYMNIKDRIENGSIHSSGDIFDTAMVPVFDGVGGLAGAKLGPNGEPGGEISYEPIHDNSVIDLLPPRRSNRMNLDQNALDNRANQLNPNHRRSGPGRPAGYRGHGSPSDLNNHANQLNPNNPAYYSSRG